MNGSLAKRVRAAAVAGWWTLLIAWLWLTFAWVVWMAILHTRPEWMLKLWGGGELTWPKVHDLMITFLAVFKMIVGLALLVVIWLTLWSARLKRVEKD